MSNNKQSSVSQLIAEIQRRVAIIQSEPQTIARELMIDNLSVDLEQYEAMHKEEVLSFNTLLHKHEMEALNNNTILLTKEEFYNETFGGNK